MHLSVREKPVVGKRGSVTVDRSHLCRATPYTFVPGSVWSARVEATKSTVERMSLMVHGGVHSVATLRVYVPIIRVPSGNNGNMASLCSLFVCLFVCLLGGP